MREQEPDVSPGRRVPRSIEPQERDALRPNAGLQTDLQRTAGNRAFATIIESRKSSRPAPAKATDHVHPFLQRGLEEDVNALGAEPPLNVERNKVRSAALQSANKDLIVARTNAAKPAASAISLKAAQATIAPFVADADRGQRIAVANTRIEGALDSSALLFEGKDRAQAVQFARLVFSTNMFNIGFGLEAAVPAHNLTPPLAPVDAGTSAIIDGLVREVKEAAVSPLIKSNPKALRAIVANVPGKLAIVGAKVGSGPLKAALLSARRQFELADSALEDLGLNRFQLINKIRKQIDQAIQGLEVVAAELARFDPFVLGFGFR